MGVCPPLERNYPDHSYYKHRRKDEYKVCVVCGVEYQRTYQSDRQWEVRLVCTRKCAAIIRSWMREYGFSSAAEFVNWRGFKKVHDEKFGIL